MPIPMLVSVAGRTRIGVGVGWFLSQMVNHFPAVGSPASPSTSAKGNCLTLKINYSSIFPSGLCNFMRYVNMPNDKGSKMFFFQLTFGNNNSGCGGFDVLLCWLFRAGEQEI